MYEMITYPPTIGEVEGPSHAIESLGEQSLGIPVPWRKFEKRN